MTTGSTEPFWSALIAGPLLAISLLRLFGGVTAPVVVIIYVYLTVTALVAYRDLQRRERPLQVSSAVALLLVAFPAYGFLVWWLCIKGIWPRAHPGGRGPRGAA